MSDNRLDAPVSSFPVPDGYEVLSELGRDRLGVVYHARQLLYGREVALRLIDERARGGGRDLTAVCHAAEAVSRLSHPHLLAVLDVGEDEGQLYLATALPPGPALRQRLAQGPLPPAEAAGLVAVVARAVHHLHEHHALHLGLTSAAIFLAPDGSPRIGNLGLSELLHHRHGSPFPGDPACAAPEQLDGSRAEPRADVHALGCLLHECLTGRPPGEGRADLPGCPAALARTCRKALSVPIDRRHGSALELAEELERFQRGEAAAPGTLARLGDWVRRRPEAAALAVALLLVLLGAAVVCAVFARQAGAARDEAANWRKAAEQAAGKEKEARDAAKKAAERDAALIRTADQKAHLAHIESNRQARRADMEAARRREVQRLSEEQSKRRDQAEQRARDADDARAAAVKARADAARRLVGLHVGHGAALLETGDLSGALVPFVRALALARQEKLPQDAHQLRIAALLSRCPRPLCLLGYPRGDLDSVHFSPDGERLLTVGADGVVRVRSALTGSVIGKPLVHGAAVAGAVFSPDSRRVLTADRMGRLRLWNAEDGKEVFDTLTLDAVPVSLGFSRDGKRFFTVQPVRGDDSAAIHVRDAGSGETVGLTITTQVAPRPAALSPDGKRLAACCTDRAARIFDIATGKQVGPALAHEGEVAAVAFSSDGRLVLTTGEGTARVWSAATGKVVLPALEHTLPGAAQLDESGRLVLTAGPRSVRLHDTTTGKLVGPELRSDRGLRQAVLSPDGRHALLAGDDGVARLLDVATGLAALPPLVHARPVVHAALAGDGSRALTFDGRALRTWDLTGSEPLSPPGLPVEPGVSYSPDGKRLARAGGDTVQVHDARTGKAVGPPMKHRGEVKSVVFSPKGDLVLTAANPDPDAGTPTWDVRVWDAATGRAVSEPMEHLREIVRASFAGDGTRVLTVAQDKRVRLLEARTGKLIGKPPEHDEDVLLAEVSPDGRRVVTSDAQGVTRVWDAATGARVGEAMGHARPVHFLAFDAGSKLLATCCEDGTARVWGLDTGRRQMEAEHAGAVTHASFSPDGKLLLTGSADGTARAWSSADGKARTPPLRHGEAVQRTAFSETGRWLLTAAGRFVYLWDAETGEPIGPPLPHASGPVVVTRLSLSKSGELVSEAGPGTRWARALVGDGRNDADLLALARVLSGRDEVGPGRLAALEVRELETAWDQATARLRGEFQQARSRRLAWARRGAAECEARNLWGGASRHLDVLLEEEGHEPALYARRGRARAALAAHEAALADYDRALEKGEGRWQWWAGRAGAAAALGRWEKAARNYTQATKLEPRRPELWLHLGQAEAQRGAWKQAAEALARAIRFGAAEPELWYELTLARLSAGDAKGYRAGCVRLTKKFAGRDDDATRRAVADACVLAAEALADFRPLLDRAEKAVAAAPADPEERARLAALLLRAGQAARALPLLEKLTAGEQARALDLWLLVLAYQRAGQKEKAKEALARATAAKERPGTAWQQRQAGALLRREAEAAAKGG